MTAAMQTRVQPVQADPLPWLGRLLASESSPSADLYFRFSHAHLIDRGDIEEYAPTVFRWGRVLIVVRHDSGLSQLPSHDRLVFVADDDWHGGLGDSNLPLAYRFRLGLCDRRAARRLEAAADVIVASCEALATIIRHRNPLTTVEVIEPCWAGPRAEMHVIEGTARRIAVLGAMSHRYDSLWLEPVLTELARGRPGISFMWSANHAVPARLSRIAEVAMVPTMTWNGYRRWLAGKRADLGLYALRPGAFNKARSINKLGEYDRLGAAVVGSDIWAAATEAHRFGACKLLPADAEAWVEELHNLLDRPGQITAMARRNREWLDQRGLVRQRAEWSRFIVGRMKGGVAPVSLIAGS